MADTPCHKEKGRSVDTARLGLAAGGVTKNGWQAGWGFGLAHRATVRRVIDLDTARLLRGGGGFGWHTVLQ